MYRRAIETLSCRALLGLGSALLVVAVLRVGLPLLDGAAGCAFIRTSLLDPWVWFALVTGASCVGFAQLQRAIRQPQSQLQLPRILSTLTQPGDIGDSTFWGEFWWLAVGAFPMLARWLLDTWC